MRRRHGLASQVLVSLAVGLAIFLGGPAAGAPSLERWRQGQLIQPDELARKLSGPKAGRPLVLQIGFGVLFQGGHIAGARYAGPASQAKGLAALRRELRSLPRTTPVVLYCGCCPWADCPNVEPAWRAAREAGLQNVRVLYIAKNLEKDWIDRGLPTDPSGR